MKKILIASIILIILIVLYATNIFGSGAKINIMTDNLIYKNKENLDTYGYLDNYTGEFSNTNWFKLVQKNSSIYDIPASLILAVIKKESNGLIWAISPEGAIGLMQVEPITADWIAQQKISTSSLFNPKNNISIGSKYLKWLTGNFRGNIKLALAGYNAGPKNAIQYFNQNIGGVKDYVNDVLSYEAQYKEEGL